MGCGASTRVAADAYAADASPPAKIAADPSSSSAASEPREHGDDAYSSNVEGEMVDCEEHPSK